MMLEQLEALVGLVAARLISRRMAPGRSMALGARVGRWLHRGPSGAGAAGRVEPLMWRGSRLVPGVDCYDRALATRWWLARRGVESEIVIGFRRGLEGWEGHAWIELPDAQALFVTPEAGYREVARESSQ